MELGVEASRGWQEMQTLRSPGKHLSSGVVC